MIPLFEHYPRLKDGVPRVSLAQLPTPIEKLERLGRELGVGELYIKRDDLTGRIYGGNKVRKLEFLLGKALKRKAKEVMTFGAAGSNHALATAIYAKRVGLRSISMLRLQPNSHHVRENLLMSHHHGVEFHHYRNRNAIRYATVMQLLVCSFKCGKFPFVIPLGGSSPLGITGYVNAALELKGQIDRGVMPTPDCIYVAMGTAGTAVGLSLGLKAANMNTRLIQVRVSDAKIANTRNFVDLHHRTNSFLRSNDPSFQHYELNEGDVDIRHDFFGQQYALFTEEGMRAVSMMKDLEGIALDGTYTGKSLAGALDYTRRRQWQDRVILFWDTYNSADLSAQAAGVDYHDLPRPFHPYFETPVQRLDTDTPPERQR